MNVKISVFESGEWKKSTDYIDELLGDPDIAQHLGHLAIHSYWSDRLDKERLIRYMDQNYPNMPIEMTEWTEMEQGRDIRIDLGLLLANTIYEDLTVGRVISWQYWIAVSKYNFHDGLIYVSLNDHEITETKRLWAMGNFSRFVRPGYQLVETESSRPYLKTTAFQSPDGSQLVVVVINNGEEELIVTINGIPDDFIQVSAYQTSQKNNLEDVFSGEVTENFTFGPKSVTTQIFQKK